MPTAVAAAAADAAVSAPAPEPEPELGGSSGREIMRSFATIREMLNDRGADTSAIQGKPLAALLAASGADRADVFSVDVSSSVRVVYDMHPKLKMTDIRKQLESSHATYIVVAREKHPLSKTSALASAQLPQPPPQQPDSAGQGNDAAAVAVAAAAAAAAREVQVFELSELQYNLSRHMLVPPHTAIRDEADIDAVLKRYTLKSRYQLPLILSTDPMARYLALKPGQLVRIVRESPSAGTYVLYRCCQRA